MSQSLRATSAPLPPRHRLQRARMLEVDAQADTTEWRVDLYPSRVECTPVSPKPRLTLSSSRPRRGKIRRFTKASRRRLMKMMASMPRERTLFVTLTYPFSVSSADFKRHLDRFSKSFLRRFPRAWYVWRAERTRRGRWHVHMIVYRVKYWDWCDLARVWARAVGITNERWLRAMTDIEASRSTRQVMGYIGKYLAKESYRREDVDEHGEIDDPGRFWGVVGRRNVEYESVSLYLPYRRFMAFRRILRRLYGVDVSLLVARNVWHNYADPLLRWLRCATGNDRLDLEVYPA